MKPALWYFVEWQYLDQMCICILFAHQQTPCIFPFECFCFSGRTAFLILFSFRHYYWQVNKVCRRQLPDILNLTANTQSMCVVHVSLWVLGSWISKIWCSTKVYWLYHLQTASSFLDLWQVYSRICVHFVPVYLQFVQSAVTKIWFFFWLCLIDGSLSVLSPLWPSGRLSIVGSPHRGKCIEDREAKGIDWRLWFWASTISAHRQCL